LIDVENRSGRIVVKGRILVPLAIALAGLVLTGCASTSRPLIVEKSETGYVSRVEPATVVSITNVTIKGERGFQSKRARANRSRAVTLVVRVERNSELVSITQGDDVGFSAGQQVWLQFGDRVRVIPR
jgi:outer membrane lipoprotein SlyB